MTDTTHLAAEAQQPSSSLPELRSSPPTVMEIIELSEEVEAAGLGQVDFAHAVLARWGNAAPQLPTDGEVAEVMGLFRHWAEAYPDSVTVDPYWLTRAADLLQRLNPPQPVPVSERLPGPKDCDAEGRCWFGTPGCDVWGASWVLRKRSHQRNGITSWLPAHSLPLPEVGED